MKFEKVSNKLTKEEMNVIKGGACYERTNEHKETYDPNQKTYGSDLTGKSHQDEIKCIVISVDEVLF
jgi:hypothetical protein